MAGVATQTRGGHDALSLAEPVYALAQCRDPACNLTARGKGKRRFDLIPPGDEQPVHEVDPRCLNCHHDLAWARGRILSLFNGEE